MKYKQFQIYEDNPALRDREIEKYRHKRRCDNPTTKDLYGDRKSNFVAFFRTKSPLFYQRTNESIGFLKTNDEVLVVGLEKEVVK